MWNNPRHGFGAVAAMMQTSFSDDEYANKKRQTRREQLLAQIEAILPWQELLAAIEPHYSVGGGRGRPPIGL
jgi:IS5 family transposase